ncbi:hypothetical protein B0H19DRAFT_1317890 [Mycena capillaripes]|nr:hypothetical protein B0H19DRAFT_1317890 [Mycena capillaripes]
MTWWLKKRSTDERYAAVNNLASVFGSSSSGSGELLSWVVSVLMTKRKVFLDEDDLNDGSDSDDSQEGYQTRTGVERLHHIPDESTSFGSDGRIRTTFTTVPTPASPAKKSRVTLNPDLPPPPEPTNTTESWEHSEFDAEYGAGIQKGPRALRGSDRPHEQWARLDRLDFLDEVLRHDGRGDYIYQATCAGDDCAATGPCFRCSDCFYPCLYCKDCVVSIHRRMPLHHIEMWDGRTFKRQSLKALGVRIQLGHQWGDPCSTPSKAAGDDFVIVNSHTIDQVGLDYCDCGSAKPKPIQLLRARLYPATGTNPRSAATFKALRHFDHLSLESKCSAYEFYNSLSHETNNTGIEPSRERYEEFLRMTRQWQHIQLIKRAGRGHDPAEDRLKATKPGECALLCPACPQPGKNLPDGWEKVPSEKATCVAHDAVDKPDRESLGTASSGIGTVDCARHNMKRPNGVGDLQKGERYLNMDYMFFMSLAGTPLLRLYVSYDIACQWYKNIWERMKIFDESVQIHERMKILEEGVQIHEGKKYVVFLVPKFHLPAHIELCNILFSFNLTPFVGRTDGEAPERGWADANRLANSTSISGPGARRDALDVHFQYWNWKKIVGLGRTLLDRVQKNAPAMLEARAAWVDMEASYPPSVIETWTAMAVTWEADASKPNPFQSTVKHESLQEVRRRQAVVASEDVDDVRVRGDMHETEMLSMGLQLEGEQRGLAAHMKNVSAHETVDQATTRIDRETKLRRKIDAWMTVQQLFIPCITLLREADDVARKRVAATQAMPGIRAQDMKLWLPSAIGKRIDCDKSLQEYEYDLRKGQAFAALDEIRGLLILRTREYLYKDDQVHGVKAKGRAAARIKSLQARIDVLADEYRAAWSALAGLGSLLKRVEWKVHLKQLKAEDVRGRPKAVFGDDERRQKKKKKKARLDPEAEARKAAQREEDSLPLSWIWIAQAGAAEPKDVVDNEFLRIEWAKTRAKAMRYAEEVELLEEEMRRVLQFMDWRAGWWTGLVGLRAGVQDEALREGHEAYARKQSGYMSGIANGCRDMWKDVKRYLELARAEYASLEPEDDGGDNSSEESVNGEGDPGWLSA